MLPFDSGTYALDVDELHDVIIRLMFISKNKLIPFDMF